MLFVSKGVRPAIEAILFIKKGTINCTKFTTICLNMAIAVELTSILLICNTDSFIKYLKSSRVKGPLISKLHNFNNHCSYCNY